MEVLKGWLAWGSAGIVPPWSAGVDFDFLASVPMERSTDHFLISLPCSSPEGRLGHIIVEKGAREGMQLRTQDLGRQGVSNSIRSF